MESRVFLFLGVFFVHVYCEYDIKQAIGKSQYLQEIEKYGASFSNVLFPGLMNTTSNLNTQKQNATSDGNDYFPLVNNTASRGSFHNATGGHYESFNSTERFLNKTISSMPRGVCVKEVP